MGGGSLPLSSPPSPSSSSPEVPRLQRAQRSLLLALLSALCLLSAQEPGEPVLARLAGGERPGELAFTVRAQGGGPIPARLTFVPTEGGTTKLFTNTAAAPGELAARDNVLYSKTGSGRITVPPGRYRVVASHGLEWSLAAHELELAPGATRSLAFELTHELDT